MHHQPVPATTEAYLRRRDRGGIAQLLASLFRSPWSIRTTTVDLGSSREASRMVVSSKSPRVPPQTRMSRCYPNSAMIAATVATTATMRLTQVRT